MKNVKWTELSVWWMKHNVDSPSRGRGEEQ